jgi:uncharacterized protein with LGFP repeats
MTFAATSALAFAVYGAIGDKWASLGGAQGPLGAPLNDESPAANGGRFNAFQHGFIYWRPDIGAHAVIGAIADKWSTLGRETGYGYPVGDDQPAANGGRFSDFDKGGSIYWSAPTGAQAVYGSIRVKWSELGREAGFLGYPVTSELPAFGDGRHSDFQGGMIYWRPATGAHAVYGRIGEKWLASGGAAGPCGYPTSDEKDGPGYLVTPGRSTRTRVSSFERGLITWYSYGDRTVLECVAAGTPPGPPPRPFPISCPQGSSDPRCRP